MPPCNAPNSAATKPDAFATFLNAPVIAPSCSWMEDWPDAFSVSTAPACHMLTPLRTLTTTAECDRPMLGARAYVLTQLCALTITAE